MVYWYFVISLCVPFVGCTTYVQDTGYFKTEAACSAGMERVVEIAQADIAKKEGWEHVYYEISGKCIEVKPVKEGEDDNAA